MNDRRILLGVTGGIACYKSAALARLLTLAGAEVDVVMTRSALEFVGRSTFEGLTGRAVHLELFGGTHALHHIRLAQRAELVIVAPATADFLARMAQGRADDLLTACVLASRSPVLVAPAMNDHMWRKGATQRNVALLRQDGIHLVDPEVGPLAAGEGEGPGRMAEPESIVEHAIRVLAGNGPLSGQHVLITAGATREAIDPVRFISNRSTGKMGVALAAAAWRRGARVTLVAGDMSVSPPAGVETVRAESTEEMHDAVRSLLPAMRVLIMAAAPADFRPAIVAVRKIRKEAAPDSLRLERTTDILRSTVANRSDGAIIVGFALETERAEESAARKLADKQLDMIVVNNATEAGAGFAVDTNLVTLITADGERIALPLMSKRDVSEAILDRVELMLNARS